MMWQLRWCNRCDAWTLEGFCTKQNLLQLHLKAVQISNILPLLNCFKNFCRQTELTSWNRQFKSEFPYLSNCTSVSFKRGFEFVSVKTVWRLYMPTCYNYERPSTRANASSNKKWKSFRMRPIFKHILWVNDTDMR